MGFTGSLRREKKVYIPSVENLFFFGCFIINTQVSGDPIARWSGD